MHDHDHASPRAVQTTTEHETESPGRSSASAALAAPANPVTSGLIRRKARHASNIAADADQAVASAGAGSGAPLPAAVAQKFGSSLGADLSAVRVHTGAESAAAAAAVGARAYTLGQDIHFGAGQYDPQSEAGEHLLAHEVAHTVQQRGGTPVRQNKLDVSSPGDAAEHDADRAADAMVTGRPASVATASGHVQRQPAPDAADQGAITVRCTAAKVSLVGKTTGSATELRKAIQRGDQAGTSTAAEAGAAALEEAETVASESRDELGEQTSAACTQLEKAIDDQAVVVLGALTIPNEQVQATATAGDSYAADVRARAKKMADRIEGANKLAAATASAGAKKGKARLEAAQQVRDILVGLKPAERSYAMSIIKQRGGAKDILDFYEGNGAELRKAGGGIDPTTANTSADSQKQGAFAGKPAERIPGGTSSVKADASTGELGDSKDWKLGGGTASAGASIDGRADDGSFRFEGAKFEAGYAMPGKATVKVNGGLTQSTTPPTFDGIRWSVAWTITGSVGAGGGPQRDVAGGAASVGGELKASGSLVKGGSKVFPDLASAEAYYKDGTAELHDLSNLNSKVPDAKHAADMKEGETATFGQSGDLGGGVSGSASGVTIGGGGGLGGGQDVKVTKGAGGTLVITVREVDQGQVSGSVGTTGLSGGAGAGNAKAVSTTCEIDLATEPGKAAYASWTANPTVAPKPGPGVKILSRGKGDFTSTNVGIAAGVTFVNGNASTTSTTGQFDETTADGKHSQTTVVGSQTTATKGLNPITPDKTNRTDSMEITTTDGDANNASYVIKSSIQGQGDAKWANGELGKVMGEPSSAGQTLDGEKSSGTTGKWSVEGTYTKAQIDDFQKQVASGKIQLKQHGGEIGNPAADLKKVLDDPKATDAAKQAAMAKWFAARGPEASSDLRAAIGPPNMNVALDGDKYLTGAAGQGVFEGKRVALEDRLLDPKLAGDAIKQLLRDVQALYAEQLERRDHIANPKNYPELPNQLRHQIVLQAAGNYAKVATLRNRVADKAKEAGLGDPSANANLNARMREVNRVRDATATLRSGAVDARAKHAGALSAGIDSPRKELGNVRSPVIPGLYQRADKGWDDGIKQMTNAEEKERLMYKEDCLDPASQATALRHAGAAIDVYHQAQKGFAACISTLQVIKDQAKAHPTPRTPASMWDGYDKRNYGTLD